MDLKILGIWRIVTQPLTPFYVVPGYTFFYWGFTVAKRHNPEYMKFFDLNSENKVVPITIKIGNRKLPAKIRIAQINNTASFEGRSERQYPVRDVVQIFWKNEYDTKKAFRKMFIYSYATTIKKNKPKLKEVAEFIHIEGTEFRVKAIAKQETDFDEMLKFMEDKDLFELHGESYLNKYFEYAEAMYLQYTYIEHEAFERKQTAIDIKEQKLDISTFNIDSSKSKSFYY